MCSDPEWTFTSDTLQLNEYTENDQISHFALKLMEIDAEQLSIPETEYESVVTMPSVEFQRICRDLSAIGDTVTISASKEGIKFAVSGDVGRGTATMYLENECDESAPLTIMLISSFFDIGSLSER